MKVFQVTVRLTGLTPTRPCFLSRQFSGFSLKLRAASCRGFSSPAVTELSGLSALESMPQRLEFPAQGRLCLCLIPTCLFSPCSIQPASTSLSPLPSVAGLILLSQGNWPYTDFFLWVLQIIWQSEHFWTFPNAGHCSHAIPLPQAMLASLSSSYRQNHS